MPKLPGVSIIPLLTAGFITLFFVLPRIDPLRSSYLKFQRYYEGFILVFARSCSLSSSRSSCGVLDTR